MQNVNMKHSYTNETDIDEFTNTQLKHQKYLKQE